MCVCEREREREGETWPISTQIWTHMGFCCDSAGKVSACKNMLKETWVWSLGWDGPLEKGKVAPHSYILAWVFSQTIQSMGLKESDTTKQISLSRIQIYMKYSLTIYHLSAVIWILFWYNWVMFSQEINFFKWKNRSKITWKHKKE